MTDLRAIEKYRGDCNMMTGAKSCNATTGNVVYEIMKLQLDTALGLKSSGWRENTRDVTAPQRRVKAHVARSLRDGDCCAGWDIRIPRNLFRETYVDA